MVTIWVWYQRSSLISLWRHPEHIGSAKRIDLEKLNKQLNCHANTDVSSCLLWISLQLSILLLQASSYKHHSTAFHCRPLAPLLKHTPWTTLSISLASIYMLRLYASWLWFTWLSPHLPTLISNCWLDIFWRACSKSNISKPASPPGLLGLPTTQALKPHNWASPLILAPVPSSQPSESSQLNALNIAKFCFSSSSLATLSFQTRWPLS